MWFKEWFQLVNKLAPKKWPHTFNTKYHFFYYTWVDSTFSLDLKVALLIHPLILLHPNFNILNISFSFSLTFFIYFESNSIAITKSCFCKNQAHQNNTLRLACYQMTQIIVNYCCQLKYISIDLQSRLRQRSIFFWIATRFACNSYSLYRSFFFNSHRLTLFSEYYDVFLNWEKM